MQRILFEPADAAGNDEASRRQADAVSGDLPRDRCHPAASRADLGMLPSEAVGWSRCVGRAQAVSENGMCLTARASAQTPVAEDEPDVLGRGRLRRYLRGSVSG